MAIAGIIAMMPRCIVLDEATAMLDPVGRRETVDTIRTLNEKYGITVILITHHMDEAAQAQRLIVMAGGISSTTVLPLRCFSMLTPCEAPVWRFQKRWGCSMS